MLFLRIKAGVAATYRPPGGSRRALLPRPPSMADSRARSKSGYGVVVRTLSVGYDARQLRIVAFQEGDVQPERFLRFPATVPSIQPPQHYPHNGPAPHPDPAYRPQLRNDHPRRLPDPLQEKLQHHSAADIAEALDETLGEGVDADKALTLAPLHQDRPAPVARADEGLEVVAETASRVRHTSQTEAIIFSPIPLFETIGPQAVTQSEGRLGFPSVPFRLIQ